MVTPDMEQHTGSELRMVYVKVVYCHLAYLTYMQSSVRFNSVTQLCLTVCDPIDWSISGLPVHHQLPEFTKTHVHWVGDTIQPSNPLSFPSPPTFNLSQHQGLFK